MNREGPDGIGYLEFTWNPVVGCTHGCPWCWARRQAKRQKQRCQKCYDFTPHLHPERLDEPLKRRKPSVIGVAFMGDLFDPTLSTDARYSVIERIIRAQQHTFIVLTKQPRIAAEMLGTVFAPPLSPLPNLVLGVSVEDQESADRLIPELMACPAAMRIVSIEPMRGPVDLYGPGYLRLNGCHTMATGESYPDFCECGGKGTPPLDGVILGGQTGSVKEGGLRCGEYAVQMDPDWVRKVRDDCAAADVPFFFKSWGALVPADQAVWNGKDRMLDGRTHNEVPWKADPRLGA